MQSDVTAILATPGHQLHIDNYVHLADFLFVFFFFLFLCKVLVFLSENCNKIGFRVVDCTFQGEKITF